MLDIKKELSQVNIIVNTKIDEVKAELGETRADLKNLDSKIDIILERSHVIEY